MKHIGKMVKVFYNLTKVLISSLENTAIFHGITLPSLLSLPIRMRIGLCVWYNLNTLFVRAKVVQDTSWFDKKKKVM